MAAEHLTEEWRPVVGIECECQVSSLGRFKRTKDSDPITPRPSGHGYCVVQFGGKSRYFHVIMAATFIGPKPLGLDVDHINLDRTDNRLVNLRYVSRSENTKNAPRVGPGAGGRVIPLDQYDEIIQARLRGEHQGTIATRYGVSRPTISKLLTKIAAGVPYEKAKRTRAAQDVPFVPKVQMLLFS